MNVRTIRLCGAWLLAGAVSAASVGCQPGKAHQENVNAADGRWRQVRSALMRDMARQQFEAGDLDLCFKTVRDALQVDPENAELHVLAGRVLLEKGRLERSYRTLEIAAEFGPKYAPAHYYQAVVLQRWQQFDRAYAAYERAFEIEPDNVSYLLAMGEMLVARGQRADAIALFEGKLTYFDQNPALRAAIGHLHKMTGRPAEAAQYFEAASLLDPDNLKLLEELALSQVAAGQTDAAVRSLRRLLNDPDVGDRPGLERALASAYEQAGRLAEARQVYAKLSRRAGADASDWIKLAELSWQAGDAGGTLQAAGRAISLAPQRHEGYLLAGLVWQRRGRLEESLRMFDRAAERAPTDASPLILRGLALQKAGRTEAAEAAYREALRRDPEDVRAKRLLEAMAAVDPAGAGPR